MQAIRLSFRPIALSIPEERREIYGRIKGLLERAEALANDHPNDRVRLKAMEVAVRIAQFLTGVLCLNLADRWLGCNRSSKGLRAISL
ncbi:hypothetical protein KEJ36_05335 [Candidatus Bathyarchaeota archaeon]|nr:hypothetical protein [Candidatus Bathyarchaeota archaeon]